MLRSKTLRVACLLLATAGLATPAISATDTDPLSVTATVVATCSITGATLAFGNYNSTQNDVSANLSVSCTNTTAYTVTLNEGLGASATTSSRKMTKTSDTPTLNYALYSDAGRTANWGDQAADDVAGTGNGAAQTLTVYGRITSGQLPTPGAYTDTVTATITY